MTNRFKGNEASEVIQNTNFVDQAAIEQGNSNPRKLIRKVTVQLDTARTVGNPYKLGFPFQALYVQSATDSASNVQFNDNRVDINSERDAITLRNRDVLNFEKPISKTFLTWEAQAGKEIVLIFILDGSFDSGSFTTEISSSVDGNSFSDHTPTTHTNAAFTQVLAQDLSRKVANLKFTNDVYLGASTSSTNLYLVPANTPVRISNTGALYAKAVGASAVSSGVIES